MNDHLMNIRVPRELAVQARQIAEAQGMSLSAFARQALHRNVRTYVDYERDLLRKHVGQ